jgi:hypothetical protein
LSVFTEEQKEAMKLLSGENGAGQIMNIQPELMLHDITNVNSTILENFKDQNETSKYVLDNWSRSLSASAEQKDVLKPIAEQYIKSYAQLRKTMETTYDKNIVDYYLERNKPADATKLPEYYRERENLFQTDPGYSKTKTAMDIEFWKLRSSYHKQAAQAVGPEKAADFLNGQAIIVHYPNLE